MVNRWWVVICASVIWDSVALLPTPDNGQLSDCCPCPKSSASGSALDDQAAAGSSIEGLRAVGGAVGDCPCRFREADSVGAPSVFLPNAVRAIRPFVALEDSKENPEPLLHPEVNLASSFLETIREATDQEYKDALARDAARSALDGDAAETVRNLVTVIVQPKDPMEDDVMAEASHVHETRCIEPPIGSSSLKTEYKPILLSDILNLPKRKPASFRSWNILDMDNAPSNVNERVVEPTFKSDFPDFKSTSESNLITDSKPQSALEKLISKLPNLTSNLQKDRSSSNPALPVLPKLTAPKIEIPSFPKLNKLSQSRTHNEDFACSDSQGATNILNERYTGFEQDKERDSKNSNMITKPALNSTPSLKIFKVPDLSSDLQKVRSNLIPEPRVLPKLRTSSKLEIPSISNLIPKLNVPNLLRTDNNDLARSDSQNEASTIKERYTSFQGESKDGDTVTKTAETSGLNSNLANPKITPSERRDAATDLLSNLLRGLDVPDLSNLFSSNVFNLRNNDQDSKSNDQTNRYDTEILDTVPSPSEIKSDHVSFSEVECKNGVNNNDISEKDEVQEILEQNPIKTEIIDHVPAPPNINEMNGEKMNILSDDNLNTNSMSRDQNSELSNVIGEINDNDMIDDAVSSASESDSQIENGNAFKGVDSDVSNDVTDIDLPQASNFDQSNQDIDEDILDNDTEKNMSLRDKIRNSLDNLKRRSKINKTNKSEYPKLDINDDFDTNSEQFPFESQNEESGKITTQILDSENPKDMMSTEKQVCIEDLQQMSNSLLDQEKLREDAITEESNQKNNVDIDRNDQMAATEFTEDGNRELFNKKSDPNFSDQSILETSNIENTNDNKISNENACLEVGSQSKVPQVDSGEMETDASERITDVIDIGENLRSPLRQNILEPPSLSDLNLPTLNMDGLFNINNPLTGVFSSRSSTDDSISTLDDEVDNLEPKQAMSSSTSSFKSAFPPLQPLEDINLDILQLKPLSKDMPTIPRLNLNSFKTRLAIPENLQLRPLLLESSVGDKKGVLGATLTFGNDKKGKGRSNMLQQASLKKPEILRQPLGVLSNLDELRDAVWENTQNLFNTPLETTSRNVVEDTLRSGQVFSENLRVGAENTVKDIQRNLESTFKGVGLNGNGLMSSSSFRNPSNWFEEISRRHDDVNDKLKGIQYDLSDRLETLRNSLFEDYRLPSLGSSFLPTLGPTLGSPMARQSSINKPKLRSSPVSNKGKNKAKTNTESKGKFTVRTSSDKGKLKVSTAASTPLLKKVKSPKVRNSESPILKALGKEATNKLLLPRERPALGILSKNEKNTIDTNRPFLKKPSFPKLSQSKVKISFSTTELPPIGKKPRFKDHNLHKPKFALNRNPLIQPLQKSTLQSNSLLIPKSTSRDKLGLFKDSNAFASEAVPSRVKAPFKVRQSLNSWPLIRGKVATMDTDDEKVLFEDTTKPAITTLKPVEPLVHVYTRPKPPTLDKVYKSNIGQTFSGVSITPKSPMVLNGTIDKITSSPLRNSLPKSTPLSWPKSVDDKFLTKVREALKARLAGISQNLNTNSKLGELGKSSTSLAPTNTKDFEHEDMARSASNNIDIVGKEPALMQEDTSYSCKMMCTKNT